MKEYKVTWSALKSFAKYQITSYLYLTYFHTPHTKARGRNDKFLCFFIFTPTHWVVTRSAALPFFTGCFSLSKLNFESEKSSGQWIGSESHGKQKPCVCACRSTRSRFFFYAVHPIRREGCAARRLRRRVFFSACFFVHDEAEVVSHSLNVAVSQTCWRRASGTGSSLHWRCHSHLKSFLCFSIDLQNVRRYTMLNNKIHVIDTDQYMQITNAYSFW